MRIRLTHLVVTIALAGSGCRERANPKDEPPPSRLSAPQADLALDKGTTDWASALKYDVRLDAARQAVVVSLDIAPGFHAYTTGETIGRPLQLEIAADSELKPGGEVQYPKGVTKDLPIGRSVIVEGKAEIVAPLEPGDVGAKKAKGKLQYQVCTDEACDRPRTVPFEVAASPAPS